MATFSLTIDGNERKTYIPHKSIVKSTNIKGRPDDFLFRMINAPIPQVDDEVIFTIDGSKEFAGRVVRVNQKTDGTHQKIYDVTCFDYSRDANKGELIAEVYEDKTGDFIINDIVTRYSQLSGFTQTNVNVPLTLAYLFLDHKNFYQALKAIADRTAYNFYIDYDKDIHFYKIGDESAPFTVTDTNGNMLTDSLSVHEKGDEIINFLVVEGGQYDASESDTENFTATGGETVIDIDGRYSGITVTVNAASQDVGTFGINDDELGTTYDVNYDFSGRRLIFASALSGGDAIVLTGFKKLPVLIQVDDPVSISDHGIIPKKIKDNSLKTLDEAKEYAFAQLEQYASDQSTGTFQTLQSGLRAGQRIRVTHAGLGIDKDFDIQRTQSKFFDLDSFVTTVTISDAEITDSVTILKELLTAKNESISGEDILRLYRLFREDCTVSDSVSVDSDKETLVETCEISDTVNDATNKTLSFVLAPYIPTGFADSKRQFLLDWTDDALS